MPPTTVAVSTESWPWSTREWLEVIGFSVSLGFTVITDDDEAVSGGVPAEASPTVTDTVYVPTVVAMTLQVSELEVQPGERVRPEGTDQL